ncbi:MAG: hypothetical protein U9O94_04345 [Nanoarchaeota archaeon]|nr:hypothetical protein [Nanoarchaeota archaeon]
MAIELIDKVAPKNDGFQGMVDHDQIVGVADGFKDEDNMLSDSATAFCSQQSIKKYVDDNAGGTVDVVSNVATDRILGRVTAGSGDSEELTVAQLRTLLNIEDGATADQSNAEIKTAYEANANTNEFSDTEQSKLAGIEDSADVNNISDVNATDLTDGGDTTLHDHDGISENTAARHAESHTVASHSDTTATGAELNELTNGSETTLHSHASGGTEFADDVFRIQDNVDDTKKIAFQASGIETGNTRTITMANDDIDLGDISANTSNITLNTSHRTGTDCNPHNLEFAINTVTPSKNLYTFGGVGDLIYSKGGLIPYADNLTLGSQYDILRAGTTYPQWDTPGISNNDPVAIDSASVANGEYARFTANGLESRSVAEMQSALGISTPTERGSITFVPPIVDDDVTILFTNRAITITEMRAVLNNGTSTPSVTWTIRHATDRSAVGNEVVTGGTTTTSISTGSDVTTFNDATIPADSFVWIEITAISGTVPNFHVTLIANID